MIKFQLPLPLFVIRWLFPGLIERAETHGKASASRRDKHGILEIAATAQTRGD